MTPETLSRSPLNPARILVIKLRHHGDMLLITPLIHALKQQYPAAIVDVLLYEETRDMLAANPFVSVGAHPLTDANALEAIRLINLWLPKAVDDGHDLQAREQMAFGQYLAGMAFNSAGLGLVHALAHQPGATHNLPHGVCNAILLPIIENFNRPNAVARFARVAQAMGVDTRGMSDEAASMEAINAIRTLSKRVGIPQGFSQLGVSKADIEGWLDKALADPCAPCNPRPASRDEVRELYLEAL